LTKHYEFSQQSQYIDQELTVPFVLTLLLNKVVRPIVKSILLPVMKSITTLARSKDQSAVQLAGLAGKIFFRATRAYTNSATDITNEIIKTMPTFLRQTLDAARSERNTWGMKLPAFKLYNRILKIMTDVGNKSPDSLKRSARDILTVLRTSIGRDASTTGLLLPNDTIALTFDNLGKGTLTLKNCIFQDLRNLYISLCALYTSL